MSFSTSALGGLKAVAGTMPRTLRSMGNTFGVVVAAGCLAAATQIAHEEGRSVISNWRSGATERRHRNTKILLMLSQTALPLEVQNRLRTSRDVVKAALALLTDPKTPLQPNDHVIIRTAVAHATGTFLHDNH